MNTFKIKLAIMDEYQEWLLAILNDEIPSIIGFEQMESEMDVFLPANDEYEAALAKLKEVIADFSQPCDLIGIDEIAERNWNEEWEKSLRAVDLGKLFIKPSTWKDEVPADRIVLHIDPKMAFGTGYHETTRLILRALPNFVKGGEFVIDAGTGTGVLSIGALKLGAAKAIGFDVDPWSFDNANENADKNGVSDAFEVREGSFETVDDEQECDLMLANINRNVILDLLPQITAKTKKDGIIILSGLLETDKNSILNQQSLQNLTLIDESQEGEWIALVYKK